MPYCITDACVACGDCTVICPQNAIQELGVRSLQKAPRQYAEAGQELSPFFYITAACNSCGRCTGICPAQAITWQA